MLTLHHMFVDCDMLMRYEWGLAVGHTYAFKDAANANSDVLRGQGLLSDDLSVSRESGPRAAVDDPAAPANGDGGSTVDGKDDGTADEISQGAAEGDALEDEDENENENEGEDKDKDKDSDDDDDEEEVDELDDDDDEEKNARNLEYDLEAEKELALFGCEDD